VGFARPVTKRSGSSSRWRWIVPVIVALAAFYVSPLRPALDRAFFDAAVRHPARQPEVPAGSALVLFDSQTLDTLSREGLGVTWPPPRATFAALIAGLERAGAKRIVLDFIFLDHSAAAEQDLLLGGLAAGLPNVVLARTEKQMPAFWDDAFVSEHKNFFENPRMGIADAKADDDGVLRHYRIENSLAAAAVADRGVGSPRPQDTSELGLRGELLRWYGGLEKLNSSGDKVPVLSAGRFVLAGLPIVSQLAEEVPDAAPAELARVLQTKPALSGPGFDAVRGRVVFVGANAAGTFDQKPLAIGGLEPGVLLHWTAWANLQSNGFIRELPASVPVLLSLSLIGVLAWAGVGRSTIWIPVGLATGLVLLVAAVAWAGISSGWFLAPGTPAVASILGLLGVITENFWEERRRRQSVQSIFGSYVATEIVDLLVRDPSAIRLGGERREATVFFCDLAGFTDLSEQVTPEQLLEMVNGYLEESSDCLMAHGAYIDKYIGDAIMAVFGTPKPLPNHALAACKAALAVQRLLAARNEQLARTHGRTLGLRIGINTGAMIVGNLGSERKKNYTVIGDAVNLASRLEGANKEFGTSIMISGETARLAGDEVITRPLTTLRVKGKKTAVRVFELVGVADAISPAQREFLEAYRSGLELYSVRRFSEAVAALERAAALAPDDRLTRHLLHESRQFSTQPPPADWEPVITLHTK
jgi:adenylate cyclase